MQQYTIQQQELYANNTVYRIKQDLTAMDWKITSDTKLIKGYRCRKAVLTEHTVGGEFKTVAWFCPQLPFQYGPAGYAGLPGLILNVKRRGLYEYYVKELCFNATSKPITPPEEGQLISKKAFKALTDKFAPTN